MNPLLVIGGLLGIVYLLSRTTGGGTALSSGVVNVGANKYQVDILQELGSTSPRVVRVTAYDVMNRPIVAVTFTNRVVTDVSVLGNYPDNLVRDYHNQLITNTTQQPEKFKL